MRLFFAIQLPAEVREKVRPVYEAARAAAGPAVGFTRLEQLHFTLAFLGEAPSADGALAAGAAVRGAPFDVAIGGRGAFPGLGRPRVLWLGVTEGASQMTAIAAQISKPGDRPFKAHLTLGRVKPRGDHAARRCLETIPLGELARFRATEFVLMQSILGPGGATHSVVRSCGL